jgi:hypothetical protein
MGLHDGMISRVENGIGICTVVIGEYVIRG